MTDLSYFKRGQIVSARMAGASVTKNRWIIWYSKEYCTESNDGIVERRKNLYTEAKLQKRVKVIW